MVSSQEELRELDRQVAEALEHRLGTEPLWLCEKCKGWVIQLTHERFTPTTDARQWAVLDDMVLADHEGNALIEGRSNLVATLWRGKENAIHEFRDEERSVRHVRAFLAWIASSKEITVGR